MENIMERDNILPADFGGTFYFTNATDEDFIGVWGGIQYRFSAKTSSPILIANETPLQIQWIRKKFAKDLAEREFFKTAKYESFRVREGVKDDMGMIQPRGQGMSHAGQYTIEDLTPFIQKCLEPLPVVRADVSLVETQPLEEKLTKDATGELNSIAVTPGGDLIEEKRSLRRKALNA